MSVCRCYLKFIFPSILIAFIIFIICAIKKLLKFLLAVKIDLVEVVYYLKQVFHLLCDSSVMQAEALLRPFHNIIDSCIT